MHQILVVDGMGGGMGKSLVASLRDRFPRDFITACGTNALATQAMLKAGADLGVTGESAIRYQVNRCDVVCGSIGIVIPHSMQGELSPAIAEAIAGADVPKFLLPVYKCEIILATPRSESLADSIDILLQQLADYWSEREREVP